MAVYKCPRSTHAADTPVYHRQYGLSVRDISAPPFLARRWKVTVSDPVHRLRPSHSAGHGSQHVKVCRTGADNELTLSSADARTADATTRSGQRVKPNTHLRRRRDETVESRRVGVGGVYMNSRRLPTDSTMRTHNAAVWATTADGCVHTDDTTKL